MIHSIEQCLLAPAYWNLPPNHVRIAHKKQETHAHLPCWPHIGMCPVFCKHSVQTQRFDTRDPRHRTSAKTTGARRLARCSIHVCIRITFNRSARSDIDSCVCSHWCGSATCQREDVRHQTIFSRRPPCPSRTCHGTLIRQRTAAVGTLLLFLVRRSMLPWVTDRSTERAIKSRAKLPRTTLTLVVSLFGCELPRARTSYHDQRKNMCCAWVCSLSDKV